MYFSSRIKRLIRLQQRWHEVCCCCCRRVGLHIDMTACVFKRNVFNGCMKRWQYFGTDNVSLETSVYSRRWVVVIAGRCWCVYSSDVFLRVKTVGVVERGRSTDSSLSYSTHTCQWILRLTAEGCRLPACRSVGFWITDPTVNGGAESGSGQF